MEAYVYQAALYCKDCALALRNELRDLGKAVDADSDYWPQGPYSQGGGEADTPQHCDACNIFLENPLTPDGVAYVRDCIKECTSAHSVLDRWSDFYGIKAPEIGPVCRVVMEGYSSNAGYNFLTYDTSYAMAQAAGLCPEECRAVAFAADTAVMADIRASITFRR